MNSKKTACIYSRCGVVDDSNTAITHQINLCREFIKQNDLEEMKIFSDVGESANNLKRAGIKKLIKFISKNKVDYIVVVSFDRLSRSTATYLHFKEIFNQNDSRVVTIKDSLIVKNSKKKFLEAVLSAAYELEIEINNYGRVKI